MSGIIFKSKGNTDKIESFLHRMKHGDLVILISNICQDGVTALSVATQKYTGQTSKDWTYEIVKEKNSTTIYWSNSNVLPSGIPIVMLIQYGHATKNGGYIRGDDFINPAMKKVFDDIAERIWKEVTSS